MDAKSESGSCSLCCYGEHVGDISRSTRVESMIANDFCSTYLRGVMHAMVKRSMLSIFQRDADVVRLEVNNVHTGDVEKGADYWHNGIKHHEETNILAYRVQHHAPEAAYFASTQAAVL